MFPRLAGSFLICVCTAVLGAACASTPPPAGNDSAVASPAEPVAAEMRTEARSLFADREASPVEQPRPAVALETQFDIWRFRIPAERLAHADGLWDHLEECVLSASKASQLRSNGIRLGVGRASSWPAVRAILLMHDPQVWTYGVPSGRAQSFSFALDDVPDATPLFYYDERGVLVGATHPGATMCFSVYHAMDVSSIGRLHLRVVPELRRRRVDGPWVRLQALDVLSQEEFKQFPQLAFELNLESDWYMVIGPGRTAGMPHLIGSRFLTAEENGTTYVNLYCVVPTILRRDVPWKGHGSMALRMLMQ